MDEVRTPQEDVPAPVRDWRRYRLYIGLGVVVLLSALTAGYLWYRASSFRKNPEKVAQLEVRRLVAAVSELIILPTDEEPVVATVVDPEKLRDQPFFAKAKKGDKVLIYNVARKAVLYSPEENRIIEVAPLNIGTPQPKP